MKRTFPEEILKQHIAFLGKTGSGKTSTAKLAVEQILREDKNARICILDLLKSDWWGLTSSADGKRPGLPFHILGGPRGHIPLHDSAGKAIGELVANGSLPLSIIDMADFDAGGIQKFFNDFAPALLRRMRGVVHLVIEESHEIAPKERAGIGAENMAIHYAKKLATAGRSKGIRLMVLTQRTQALHNALLGSCETMIAHRLTAPADQDPVKKWLKANVDKEIFEKVSGSLASLKTGSGWMCSGEAQVAERIQFPPITTYDNSATPTGDTGDHAVKTAPVDQERLRAIIGNAVKEAEADDPKKLRIEIAKLTTEKQRLERLAAAAPAEGIPVDPKVLEAAVDQAYAEGSTLAYGEGFGAGWGEGFGNGWTAGFDSAVTQGCDALQGITRPTADEAKRFAPPVDAARLTTTAAPPRAAPPARQAIPAPIRKAPVPASRVTSDAPVSPTVRKILDVIHRAYPMALTFEAASLRAAVSRRSSAYSTYRQQIDASHEVERRDDGRFRSAPGFTANVGPGLNPVEEFAAKLPPSFAKMLRSIAASRRPLSKGEIAEQANISPTSSGLSGGLRELMQLSLIESNGDAFTLHRDLTS